MINPSHGCLYIVGDEETKKIGEVKYVELETTPEDPPEIPIPVTGLEATFEMCCKISKELILAILGFRERVLDICPNKRVVHLAKHGRNKKIRKKNFNRAIRILEEM